MPVINPDIDGDVYSRPQVWGTYPRNSGIPTREPKIASLFYYSGSLSLRLYCSPSFTRGLTKGMQSLVLWQEFHYFWAHHQTQHSHNYELKEGEHHWISLYEILSLVALFLGLSFFGLNALKEVSIIAASASMVHEVEGVTYLVSY